MNTENTTETLTPEATSDLPNTCQLNLRLIDVVGNSIKALDYRIEIDGKAYIGATDNEGLAQTLLDLPLGAIAQVFVKRLDGTFKFVGETPLNSVEVNICAVSPKVLIETETVTHDGDSGSVDTDIEKIDDKVKQTQQDATEAIKEANASMAEAVSPSVEATKKTEPETITDKSTNSPTSPVRTVAKPISMGGRPPNTDTQIMRDQKGRPHALVKETPKNWFDKHFPGTFYIWRIADFLKPAPEPSRIQPTTKDEIKEYRKESTINKSHELQKNKQGKKSAMKPNIDSSFTINAPTIAPSTRATVPVPVNADNLEQLQRLFEFAEKQAYWKYPAKTTAEIASLFTQAKWSWLQYMDSEAKKGERYLIEHTKVNPTAGGLCYPYVKIALWHSGITAGLLGGEFPGLQAGNELIKFGFRDVTAEIPDVRWAAPGDVITYQWTDETWEKRKEKKHFKTKEARDAYPNYGHIEIRTYDGYISDGIIDHYQYGTYKNIAIYRKIYDPLAVIRMKAFLAALIEIETKGIPKDKKYSRLNTHLPSSQSMYFQSFEQHPWSGLPKPTGKNESTAAGAYQIVVGTAEDYIEKLDLPKNQKEKFSPEIQSRIAVAIMESPARKGALGAVRRGEIDIAIKVLRNEWSSLPDAKESHINNSDFMKLYNNFFDEEKLKVSMK